jgi:hypothetical protein
MAKVGATTNATSITKPSELRPPSAAAPAAPGAPRAMCPHLDRDLPPPIKIAFGGGDQVTLLEDQLYADKVLVRKGERGRVMYPSSQAASWVVHFPRVGAKYRVVPERLLARAEAPRAAH